MVEVHPVMVYMYEGDSCDRPYIAHSGLVDVLGSGSTKEAAIDSMKYHIQILRTDPGAKYKKEPPADDDAFMEFRKNPLQYQAKIELLDKDTWLWVYDLGAIEDPKMTELLAETQLDEYIDEQLSEQGYGSLDDYIDGNKTNNKV